MKNFLIASALLLTSGLFAQKGSFYVGGQMGYSSTKAKVEGNTTFDGSTWNFSPEVGTFLTNNVQLGVGFTTQGSTKEYGNTEVKENQYGGTIYSRYFFGEGSKSFRPFVGVNLGLLPEILLILQKQF
ncbi:outer membrane beta-barrel protein [Flavobacterium davisii]|uniref:Outer membrane beta-barrel protein n=1 Tax=Flavobacterium columnare TaxID=996 RepID=A0A8G0KS77_9FLAO|nr:outer membrane beta-barrel protein [Flavobacterium davisii]QYS89121.1 outer membrane beta-barrel protein [Flavobacterium davisii]